MQSLDPNRGNFAPYGFTCTQWRACRSPKADRHNEIEVNLLRSGSITYLMGGRQVQVEPLQLHVFWAAVPHQIVYHQDTDRILVTTIPLAWFLQWQLPEGLVKPLLQGEVIRSEEARGMEDASLLQRCIEDMESRSPSRQKAVMLEIQARLLRLAASSDFDLHGHSPGARRASDLDMGKAEQMARFIAQHCTEHLTASDVGKAVSLHPNYAMGLFKSVFSTTLGAYLCRERISHAQQLLTATHLPIGEVALSSGFASISRFNAAFRASCGCTPRQYRRGHRQGPPAPA